MNSTSRKFFVLHLVADALCSVGYLWLGVAESTRTLLLSARSRLGFGLACWFHGATLVYFARRKGSVPRYGTPGAPGGRHLRAHGLRPAGWLPRQRTTCFRLAPADAETAYCGEATTWRIFLEASDRPLGSPPGRAAADGVRHRGARWRGFAEFTWRGGWRRWLKSAAVGGRIAAAFVLLSWVPTVSGFTWRL